MKKVIYIFVLFSIFSPSIFPQEGDGYGFWSLNTNSVGRIYAMVSYPLNPDVMYAAGLDQGVFASTDGGLSWIQRNNGLLNIQVQALAISDNNPIGFLYIYAGTAPGTNGGVYRSSDGGANWTMVNNGITESNIGIQALMVNPQDPYTVWTCVFDGVSDAVNGIYKTTNGGDNWFPITNGLGAIKNFLSLAMQPYNPNIVYLGSSFSVATSTGPSAIYKSTDGGANWILSSNGLPTDPTAINPIRFIATSQLDPNFLFAGLFMNTTDGGAYFSTDGGNNWVKKWNGAPSDVGTLLRSGAISPFWGAEGQIFIGLDRSTGTNIGIWRSTDGGNNWTSFNSDAMLNTYAIRALALGPIWIETGNTLYAGCSSTSGNGIYEYTFPIPVELVSFSAYVFGGDVDLSWITATELNNCGFHVERRNAESVEWMNIGFVNGSGTTAETKYYSFSDNSVSKGKYFYRLKQMDFSGSYEYSDEVEITIIEVLNDFELNQNYPNPFNPSTRISFSVPQNSFVTLKVFDILGNEIETLVNRDLSAGSYDMEFVSKNITSGVYFYNLTAGEFTKTMKMILSK